MPVLSRFTSLLRALPVALLALTGCSSLGVLNAALPKDGGSAQVARDLTYGPDPRQRLDVYAPEGTKPGDRKDVVVFVYGGSWDNGERSDYSFAGRAFASRGFVTVLFDYRLVPDHPYPDFVADTASAVAWAHRNAAQYGGDPDRIFLVGHSAGAYNAVMVGVAPQFLRDAGVSPGVLKGVAGLSGPYDFLPLDSRVTKAAFGHLKPDALRLTQPIERVKEGAATPSMLLLHGDQDGTVWPRNTTRLAKALEDAGRPVEAKIYPGIGHAGIVLALSRPWRSRAPVLDDVSAFFKAQR